MRWRSERRHRLDAMRDPVRQSVLLSRAIQEAGIELRVDGASIGPLETVLEIRVAEEDGPCSRAEPLLSMRSPPMTEIVAY